MCEIVNSVTTGIVCKSVFDDVGCIALSSLTWAATIFRGAAMPYIRACQHCLQASRLTQTLLQMLLRLELNIVVQLLGHYQSGSMKYGEGKQLNHASSTLATGLFVILRAGDMYCTF